jgi:hypothetical protein
VTKDKKTPMTAQTWGTRFSGGNGSGPVGGPLVLVLKKLDRHVKLVNRTGVGRQKKPFLVIRRPGGDNMLDPGESVTVVLDFKASAETVIRFRPQVMAGLGIP